MTRARKSYCAKCGRDTINWRTGWICHGCGSSFCLGCKHDERGCIEITRSRSRFLPRPGREEAKEGEAMRTSLQAQAFASPMTRANRTPDVFVHSKDGEWRAAVTVNK